MQRGADRNGGGISKTRGAGGGAHFAGAKRGEGVETRRWNETAGFCGLGAGYRGAGRRCDGASAGARHSRGAGIVGGRVFAGECDQRGGGGAADGGGAAAESAERGGGG